MHKSPQVHDYLTPKSQAQSEYWPVRAYLLFRACYPGCRPLPRACLSVQVSDRSYVCGNTRSRTPHHSHGSCNHDCVVIRSFVCRPLKPPVGSLCELYRSNSTQATKASWDFRFSRGNSNQWHLNAKSLLFSNHSSPASGLLFIVCPSPIRSHLTLWPHLPIPQTLHPRWLHRRGTNVTICIQN